MRVWILEYAPDHEPVERIGAYGTPHHAGDDFLKQVDRLRKQPAGLGMVTIGFLGGSTDVALIVRSEGGGGRVMLTGVHVKRSPNRPLASRDQGVLEVLREKALAQTASL